MMMNVCMKEISTKEISLRWMKIVRSGKFRHENVCKKMLMDILDSSGRKK